MSGRISPDEVNVDRALEIGETTMKTFELSWPTGFNAPISKEVKTKPLARNGNFLKNAVINIFFTVTSKMAQLHIFRGLWFRLA